ncbi:hypothetical protein GH810_06700 [Acetobacterium paludosum]|uniref:Phosphatase PAP2 family protein n=1 Tax=Acetobacterium paludosum TaxID=52693 RepID=A0A923HVH3_9FIRM|nr:hypothetical protein [Acetobacterium paludosum]MBC3887995.1 hypothetical protein [Acetobacterium paludosum]
MKAKAAKIISIITIAPIMSFCMFSFLYVADSGHFQNLTNYLLAVICFAFIPILAYPLQKFLPKFKDKGRDGQRKLAFIFVILGYTLGLISAFIAKAPIQYLMIYISYFLSGLILTFVNKILKIKASGHACGVMGPVVVCIYFLGNFSWLFLLLLPIVFWARMKIGRHTLKELLLGAAVSLLCTLLAIIIIL